MYPGVDSMQEFSPSSYRSVSVLDRSLSVSRSFLPENQSGFKTINGALEWSHGCIMVVERTFISSGKSLFRSSSLRLHSLLLLLSVSLVAIAVVPNSSHFVLLQYLCTCFVFVSTNLFHIEHFC